MRIENFTDIPLLIEKANNQGITISTDDGGLKIAFRKGLQIDQVLIQELKTNKNIILEYLSMLQEPAADGINEINSQCDGMEYEGRYYYNITPIQFYWADDDTDREFKETESAHGIIKLLHKVYGAFRPDIFKLSVQVVLQHHESLRATFHKINGKYWMRIEDGTDGSYETEIMDVRNLVKENSALADDIATCKDRPVSLKQGPLFISRITRVGDEEYAIMLKMHHIISDTWSNEVLLRDLLAVYNNLGKGEPPLLPELKFQFKECMAYQNNHRSMNYESQKNYWKDLYTKVPGKLQLPGLEGKEEQSVKPGIRSATHFFVEHGVRSRLTILAKEFNTTLFVILQAGFKTYLYCKTGQHDILIGTMVLGRDIPELYDQIGSYARTDLIRTVFDKDDTFADAVRKVKGSNAELVQYKDFSLKDAMAAMIPAEQYFRDFWLVNMLYSDSSIFHTSYNTANDALINEMNIEITPMPGAGNTFIAIPLVIDIMNRKEQLVLEVQYNSCVYTEATITALFKDYLTYMQQVIIHTDVPLKTYFRFRQIDTNLEWSWIY